MTTKSRLKHLNHEITFFFLIFAEYIFLTRPDLHSYMNNFGCSHINSSEETHQPPGRSSSFQMWCVVVVIIIIIITHKHTFQTGLTVINDKIWKRWCLLSRIISESSVMRHRLHRTGWTPTLVHYESFHLLRINDYVQGICVIFCSLALIALKSLRLNERIESTHISFVVHANRTTFTNDCQI